MFVNDVSYHLCSKYIVRKKGLFISNPEWPNPLKSENICLIHFTSVLLSIVIHFGNPFSPLDGHTNYVKVIKDGGCWSQIGMIGGGEQELSLVGNLGGIIWI